MALSIKTRLILMGTLLAVVPTVIVGIIISEHALQKGTDALQATIEKGLKVSRNLTAQAVETYFSDMENHIISLSSNKAVEMAADDLIKAYNSYDPQANASDYSKLVDYYNNQFDAHFKQLNAGQSSNPQGLLDQLSPIAKALQTTYIAKNSASLGQKDTLDNAGDNSAYDKEHQEYHPMFHSFQKRYGLYDIFVVDANTGNVVYTVFKELDFATSLVNGPYKNTGLAKAYQMALNGDKDTAFLTDFSAYGPSYNAAASFISSPIYENGKISAVLIFQLPLDQVDMIMEQHKNWKDSGLGETGQTYLVGKDKLMRSNERTLIENKADYIKELHNINTPADLISKIASRDTTVGLLKVDSPSIEQALKGKTGTLITTNYLGDPSLAAFRPLNIPGVDWAIISEVEQSEAFKLIRDLESSVYTTLGAASAIALVVGALLGLLLSKVIVRPIDEMVKLMHDIAEGEGDLTQRLPTKSKDELADLAKGINLFITHIDKTFSSVLGSVVRLKPISEDMADVNSKLASATENQKTQAEQVNLRLEDTNESTKIVESELSQINQATIEGNSIVHTSGQVVNKVSKAMTELSQDIAEAVDAISKLKGETDRIAGIIDVINGIAEQTNLLALNAAIEAARAGEAGRGFAVVADEVRSLASKTRQSTDEVANMVGAIQNGTMEVVKRMENSKDNAEQSSIHVNEATQSLEQVKQAMQTISERVEQIAGAITSQQDNFLEVTEHYDNMRQSFVQINEQTEHSTLVGRDVIKLSDNIMVHITRFKVTDNNWSTDRRDLVRQPSDK